MWVQPPFWKTTRQTTLFNDTLIFEHFNGENDPPIEENSTPLIELQSNEQKIVCTPNTAFNKKNQLSVSTQMKVREITELKPQKQTIIFLNNSELPLLDSVQLKVQNDSRTLTLLFYITLIELPYTLLGVVGLDRIYPLWSFENLQIPKVQKESLDKRNNYTSEVTSVIPDLVYVLELRLDQMLSLNQEGNQLISNSLQDMYSHLGEMAK